VATFVCIHGGYHGGWCFDRLAAELAALGHQTIAPDLPIDDADAGYVEYAAAVLDAMHDVPADEDVVLVGHSLGCYVVPLVAEQRPARHLVFLCAVPAGLGEPLSMGSTSVLTDDLINTTYFADARGRTLQTAASFRRLFWDDVPEIEAALALAKLRPQGSRPMTDTWPLQAWPDVPRTIVLADNDNVVRFDAARCAAKELTGEEPIVVPGGHSVFLTDPAGLAAILTKRATSDSRGG
jgi:pimeloyl-ACP methyl ester carboxylesterase